MENYNLNFQQELSRHAVLQIGYVGSQGKTFRFPDLNQPSNARITACDLGDPPDRAGAPAINSVREISPT